MAKITPHPSPLPPPLPQPTPLSPRPSRLRRIALLVLLAVIASLVLAGLVALAVAYPPTDTQMVLPL